MEYNTVNDRYPNFRDAEGSLLLFRCYACDNDSGFENDLSCIAQGICSNCGYDDSKIAKIVNDENNQYTEEEINVAVKKFKECADLRQGISMEILKFIALNNKFSFEELIDFWNDIESVDMLIYTIAVCQNNNILSLEEGFSDIVVPAINALDELNDFSSEESEEDDDDMPIEEIHIIKVKN